jgi:hypothetical protein
MKTLKTITLSFIFAALATVAMANSTITKDISTFDDLKLVIKEKVESDFSKPLNYLNEKGITRLEEEVDITFFISPEQTIRIISINCEDSYAYNYIKQLLNKEKLNVNSLMTGKVFKMRLKLDYKTV